MNMPSPDEHDDGGGEYFLDENDIIQDYDIDEEELLDADEEGVSDGEADFDNADDSVHIFNGHTGELYAIACSPSDATLVATGGGDDKVFFWRIFQGDWALELQGHAESVSSLSFSTDGQLLATGDMNGLVKVWDVVSGDLKFTLEGPGEIQWVRWHPRGHVVLAGSVDSSIWMWNADRGIYMNSFPGHGSSVTCGDFTPDGRKICSCSDDATMRIFNPSTATVIHVIEGHRYHSDGVICLTITSDSMLALSGAKDGSLCVVNIETGQIVSSLNGHSDSVECAAFEPSSRRDRWRAATGALDNKLIIWDQDSSPRPRSICEHEAGVTCLLWLSGSRYIATGTNGGIIQIWDSLSGECVRILRGHTDNIQSISASNDGRCLVSASLDNTARVFEIAEFI